MDNQNQSVFNHSQSTEQQSSTPQAKTARPIITFVAIAAIVFFAILIGILLYRSYQPKIQTVNQVPGNQKGQNSLDYDFLKKNIITWDEAKVLINDCVVKMVSLSKAGDVGIVLIDEEIKGIEGSQNKSIIAEEADKASAKCGFSVDVLKEP